MSVLLSWLSWANVPFLSALAIAVLFATLQATGLLGLLAGGDHDGDHDADGDGDADGDAYADAHSDGDAHVTQEGFSIAGLLGVGRVPLTFLLQSFAIALGIAGLSIHTIAYGIAAPPTRALLWSAPLAIAIALTLTSALARVAGRIFSTEGQEASRRSQLVGSTGVVISSRVDREFGEVRISTPTGVTVRVIVSTEDEQPIAEGNQVVVTEYDRERDRLVVAALDEDDRARRRSGAA
jgi:membrane protein implicated in regulation of membrane protease activity